MRSAELHSHWLKTGLSSEYQVPLPSSGTSIVQVATKRPQNVKVRRTPISGGHSGRHLPAPGEKKEGGLVA